MQPPPGAWPAGRTNLELPASVMSGHSTPVLAAPRKPRRSSSFHHSALCLSTAALFITRHSVPPPPLSSGMFLKRLVAVTVSNGDEMSKRALHVFSHVVPPLRIDFHLRPSERRRAPQTDTWSTKQLANANPSLHSEGKTQQCPVRWLSLAPKH